MIEKKDEALAYFGKDDKWETGDYGETLFYCKRDPKYPWDIAQEALALTEQLK
jgi:hypothetical protein